MTQQPTQRPDRAATLARTAAALAADLVVLQRRQQEAVAISDATGMLCHYWVLDNLSGGVGSPPATSGARTAQWRRCCCGRGCGALLHPRLDTGYCFVTQGDRTRMLISPLNALMRLQGSRHEFRLHARPLTGGELIRLDCSAAPEQYNDLGEGIRQTLLGTCRVDGATAVSGSAGLEVRGY